MVFAHRLNVRPQFVRYVRDHMAERFGVDLEETVIFYDGKVKVQFDLATVKRAPTVIRCCYAIPDQDLRNAYMHLGTDAKRAKARKAIYATNILQPDKQEMESLYGIRIYDAMDLATTYLERQDLDRRIRESLTAEEEPLLRRIRWL